MSLVRSFVLDRKLFNAQLYSGLIKLWLDGVKPRATYPDPSIVARWYGIDATEKAAFDSACSSASGEALRSIGPSQLVLPPFVNVDADRGNYAELASPFVGELEGAGGSAARGEEAATDAALGLTLLLDQMPRNIFRNEQALIYGHYDRLARAVAAAIRARGLDVHARFANAPPWRNWFFMPLEHSEAAADQALLREQLRDLRARAEARADFADPHGFLQQQVDFAERHAAIIRRFGRFPHRNRFLGRTSTPEEEAWLAGGGDTFGTDG